MNALTNYHEDTEEGPRLRSVVLCPEHFERFILLHPDAYGTADDRKCSVCGKE